MSVSDQNPGYTDQTSSEIYLYMNILGSVVVMIPGTERDLSVAVTEMGIVTRVDGIGDSTKTSIVSIVVLGVDRKDYSYFREVGMYEDGIVGRANGMEWNYRMYGKD